MTTDPVEFARTPGQIALWSGVLVGPAAWIAHQQIGYGLAAWVCATGHRSVLYLLTLACLALVLAAAALAWRNGRRSEEGKPGEADDLSRARFMSKLGLLSSLLFGLVIIAQAVPLILLFPCTE